MRHWIAGVLMLVSGLTGALAAAQTTGGQWLAPPARLEAAAGVPADRAALGYLEFRKRHPRNFQGFWDTRLPAD